MAEYSPLTSPLASPPLSNIHLALRSLLFPKWLAGHKAALYLLGKLLEDTFPFYDDILSSFNGVNLALFTHPG